MQLAVRGVAADAVICLAAAALMMPAQGVPWPVTSFDHERSSPPLSIDTVLDVSQLLAAGRHAAVDERDLDVSSTAMVGI